jgi:hypothetical protein
MRSNYYKIKEMKADMNGTAIMGRAVRWPKLPTLILTTISLDGAAVAMKLLQAAIVAVGAIYVDSVVPDP